MKKHLLGMTSDELKADMKMLGMPSFTYRQILSWVYEKRACSINDMTDISQKNREILAAKYEVGRTKPEKSLRSKDGTEKYLFRVGDNSFIESVYIPDKDRATLCISSQVGCKMNCHFCMTAKQGFTENLNTNQILNQIYSVSQSESLTNLVFMGMGEPFNNMEAVLKAIEIMTSDYGPAWSPKRITVSTVGIGKEIRHYLESCDCHLAISLHSPFHEERARIMPVEKAFPVKDIIDTLKEYDFSKQRRLSFEYIMFKGVNDDMRHANELIKLLKPLKCRVNLIRFHAIPGVELEGTSTDKITEFRDYLTTHGVFTTIRASRGEDIFAACGMLSTAEKSNKKKHP